MRVQNLTFAALRPQKNPRGRNRMARMPITLFLSLSTAAGPGHTKKAATGLEPEYACNE